MAWKKLGSEAPPPFSWVPHAPETVTPAGSEMPADALTVPLSPGDWVVPILAPNGGVAEALAEREAGGDFVAVSDRNGRRDRADGGRVVADPLVPASAAVERAEVGCVRDRALLLTVADSGDAALVGVDGAFASLVAIADGDLAKRAGVVDFGVAERKGASGCVLEIPPDGHAVHQLVRATDPNPAAGATPVFDLTAGASVRVGDDECPADTPRDAEVHRLGRHRDRKGARRSRR